MQASIIAATLLPNKGALAAKIPMKRRMQGAETTTKRPTRSTKTKFEHSCSPKELLRPAAGQQLRLMTESQIQRIDCIKDHTLKGATR